MWPNHVILLLIRIVLTEELAVLGFPAEQPMASPSYGALSVRGNAAFSEPALSSAPFSPCATAIADRPAWLDQAGNWTQIQCSIFGENNTESGPQYWKQANASGALTELINAWLDPDRAQIADKDNTFTNFALKSMYPALAVDDNNNVPNCSQVLAVSPACWNIQAQYGNDGATPAGTMIINSIAGFNRIISSQDSAVTQAVNTLNGEMETLVKTFAPAPDNDLSKLNSALGIISSVLDAIPLGSMAGRLVSILPKVAAQATNIERLQSTLSNGLSLSTSVIQQLAPQTSSQADVVNALSTYVTNLQTDLQKQGRDFLFTVTQPQNQNDADQLTNVITDGLMYDTAFSDNNFASSIPEFIEQWTRGQTIQAAWKIGKAQARPYVARIDRDVLKRSTNWDDWPEERRTWIAQDVINHATWCAPDSTTFMLINSPDPGCSIRGNQKNGGCPAGTDSMQTLPGGTSNGLGNGTSDLDFTIEDVVKSVYGAFIYNNETNGKPVPANTSLTVNDDLTVSDNNVMPIAGVAGTSAPGFWNIPICLGLETAFQSIREHPQQKLCPDAPHADHTQAPTINEPSSFTPGWCTMRITQYQSREGTFTNPENAYQMSIYLYDGGGSDTGGFAKDPVSGAAIIVDSTLPYRVMVAPGAADDDPVQIWYANQYWDTDSQSHQCAWQENRPGGNGQHAEWADGWRGANCGFSCPMPRESDPPPISATVAHPLQAIVTAAINEEANTFTDMWSMAGATPTPPPPSAYQQGDQCTVQMTVYQAGTSDDKNPSQQSQQSPTMNIMIELYLEDNKGNFVGATGKIVADHTIHVRGLDHDFTVDVGKNWNDPIEFNYYRDGGEQFWAGGPSGSRDCDLGKPGEGGRNRQLNCKFTC